MSEHAHPRSHAATSLLSQLLYGLTAVPRPVGPDYEPDFSLHTLTVDPESGGVQADVELPSGDRYRVTVEWLSEVSP